MRTRMAEMVGLAERVDPVVCATPLEAEVRELRLIAEHRPRYNRRSKFPERTSWVKITTETFPRLSIVGAVRDDGASYFGPFPRRQAAEDVVLAVYDGFPLRQCTARLSATRPVTACALAGMGRCCAPCDGSVGPEEYSVLVERVRAALCSDARPAVSAVSERLTRLVAERRYEEAETIRRRLETLGRTARRYHRVSSLAACPEIVAARREGSGWDIHVIRYGRLASSGVAGPHDVPQAVARSTVATAETVRPAPAPLPAAGIEETEQIADWLEQPGVRLMHIEGDWAWPLHAVLDHETLVQHALGGTTAPQAALASA
jgi:DNA polymerase-3 subunit epsilon